MGNYIYSIHPFESSVYNHKSLNSDLNNYIICKETFNFYMTNYFKSEYFGCNSHFKGIKFYTFSKLFIDLNYELETRMSDDMEEYLFKADKYNWKTNLIYIKPSERIFKIMQCKELKDYLNGS